MILEASGPIVIVGQGYVGLPVAMRAVEVGYNVVGIDLDPKRVQSLVNRISYVEDISTETLSFALDSNRYTPTTRYDHASGFRVAVITVPTPLRDSLPDLSYIESAASSLAPHLTLGASVILESTTYPGTTEELLVPILEKGSGLIAGQDFHVGYSPERIDPGNQKFGFVNTPKVVSGISPTSLSVIEGFYASLVETTVSVSTPKEAELTKLLENTFRHVNIALVNELAVYANQLGVDIWESIDAAATKPFGFMKFTPGPGVGGHCLPVDPSYLSWQVKRQLGQTFRFVELANDVNDHMPDYIVQRLASLLNDQKKSINGSNILLLGVSYKKNTGDTRQAPSIKVGELLRGLGAVVSAADPYVEDHLWPVDIFKTEFSPESLESADAVILLSEHDDFELSLLQDYTGIVFDTKGVIRGERAHSL